MDNLVRPIANPTSPSYLVVQMTKLGVCATPSTPAARPTLGTAPIAGCPRLGHDTLCVSSGGTRHPQQRVAERRHRRLEVKAPWMAQRLARLLFLAGANAARAPLRSQAGIGSLPKRHFCKPANPAAAEATPPNSAAAAKPPKPTAAAATKPAPAPAPAATPKARNRTPKFSAVSGIVAMLGGVGAVALATTEAQSLIFKTREHSAEEVNRIRAEVCPTVRKAAAVPAARSDQELEARTTAMTRLTDSFVQQWNSTVDQVTALALQSEPSDIAAMMSPFASDTTGRGA